MQSSTKNIEHNEQEKAKKVYELTQYYKKVKAKRKAICAAMTDEMKRTQSEIDDIISGNMTAGEILENVHTPHDLEESLSIIK